MILLLILPLFSKEKIEINLIKQIYLDQEKEILEKPTDIAIDNQENIFITDYGAGDVKIYDKNGKLKKVFGRRGEGPGEFLRPFTIDFHQNKFCMVDTGRFHIYLYDNEFNKITDFFYIVGRAPLVLTDDSIVTGDYFKSEDGKEYVGIIFDFSGKIKELLIPIPWPKGDFWHRVGLEGFVDIDKNKNIYYSLKREIKIYKFDNSGRRLKVFGKIPSYYKPPKLTKKFKEWLFQRKKDSWEEWYYSYSWVSGFFVLKNFIGNIIRNYNKKSNKSNCWLQFYDLEGNLVEEGIRLREPSSSSRYFFVDSNHDDSFYILETILEDEEINYKFYKYNMKVKK